MKKRKEGIIILIDTILVYGPEKELEVLATLAKSGNKIDWKPAIILASAYLERYGKEKLVRHFAKKKIKLVRKLEYYNLNQITTFLYGLELIKPKFFTCMNTIWRKRSKIIHPRGTLPAFIGTSANKEYGKLVKDALKIISFLKSEEE